MAMTTKPPTEADAWNKHAYLDPVLNEKRLNQQGLCNVMFELGMLAGVPQDQIRMHVDREFAQADSLKDGTLIDRHEFSIWFKGALLRKNPPPQAAPAYGVPAAYGAPQPQYPPQQPYGAPAPQPYAQPQYPPQAYPPQAYPPQQYAPPPQYAQYPPQQYAPQPYAPQQYAQPYPQQPMYAQQPMYPQQQMYPQQHYQQGYHQGGRRGSFDGGGGMGTGLALGGGLLAGMMIGEMFD